MRRFAYVSATGMALMFSGAVPALAGWFGDYFDAHRNSCYGRIYTVAHMKRHPRQKVARISLSHFPTRFGINDQQGRIVISNTAREILLQVKVRFRGSRKTYAEVAFCRHEGDHVACRLECDGGEFTVHAHGGRRLLLRPGSYGFRMSDCGESDACWVTRKSDDRALVLNARPASKCTPPAR